MGSIEDNQLYIEVPDFHANWPIKPIFSQAYELPAQQSTEWVFSHITSGSKGQELFRAIKVGVLAAYAYTDSEAVHRRILCDALSLLFLMDDMTDLQSPDEVEDAKCIIVDAFRNPQKPRSNKENPIGEVHRSFVERASKIGNKSSISRFIKSYEDFLNATKQQAIDRKLKVKRSIEEYNTLRRMTGGVLPAIDLLLLGEDRIPERLLDHPVILELSYLATDLVWLSNDVFSFKAELTRNDIEHNMVTIIMSNNSNLTLQQAVDEVGNMYQSKIDQFLKLMKMLPTNNESTAVKKAAEKYVQGMANWITGNVEWSYDSERYLGKDGAEIRKTRRIYL